ncbi:MAG TPA: response regulator [Pirellulales bacterium]|nr:response regulator [Pirellulales bacterium]
MIEATVYIIDDDTSLREALGSLMSVRGFRTELFADAESFLAAYEGGAGCVLLDLRLGNGMSGERLQQELAVRGFEIPVIIMSAYVDLPTAVATMKQGAVDVFVKPVDDDALTTQVRTALEKDLARFRQRNAVLARLRRLSRRQREVMRLLLNARDTKEIAHELAISPKTVEKHRNSLLAKMDVPNVVALVRCMLPEDVATGLTVDGHATQNGVTAKDSPVKTAPNGRSTSSLRRATADR